MKKVISLLFCLLAPLASLAKLNVVTTTTDLKNLVELVGGDNVVVDSFCKGTQDPHYLEAKPSFMLKAHSADLLVSVGFDLEVGWLPLIIRGARNPKIREGGVGSFVAGAFIEALEKKSPGSVSRADGDVHPEGNPHFLLDPQNALVVAEKLKNKLSELDPANAAIYTANFTKFADQLKVKLTDWQRRVGKDVKVITYHKTFTYFFHRFNITNVAILEPKPGVAPTAQHIIEVMRQAKSAGVRLALIENYFDPTVAKRVAKDVPGMSVAVVPVAVGGTASVLNIFDLYELLVKTIESY